SVSSPEILPVPFSQSSCSTRPSSTSAMNSRYVSSSPSPPDSSDGTTNTASRTPIAIHGPHLRTHVGVVGPSPSSPGLAGRRSLPGGGPDDRPRPGGGGGGGGGCLSMATAYGAGAVMPGRAGYAQLRLSHRTQRSTQPSTQPSTRSPRRSSSDASIRDRARPS